jgi:predicted alpha/beta-hydrolase family hydrolase
VNLPVLEQINVPAGELPGIRGFLHGTSQNANSAFVLTHGAGANCNAPLLVTFSKRGTAVLRCDLPFRQERPKGPPIRSADRDQAGLLHAARWLRARGFPTVYLGGHSYGGRMASMLAAQQPEVADGLLLLSYPLHPPGKPHQLRTAHFPELRTPALFVHGVRDEFATSEEMRAAMATIPARTQLLDIEAAGHELASAKTRQKVAELVVEAFALSTSGAEHQIFEP